MLTQYFVTKLGMTQAWTQDGKRLPVTRCKADTNAVVSSRPFNQGKHDEATVMVEIGYGAKKLKNVHKPLRSTLTKSGFSVGVRHMRGVQMAESGAPAVGTTVKLEEVLAVGDLVNVCGISRGRGFAGAIKRHGFHGGPKTHGQSDRARAVGSIGAGTTPGRVFKGKKMPGHYGTDTKTVSGLQVIHIDAAAGEVWLSGPVPGSKFSFLCISKTGKNKLINLDLKASGITPPPVVEETPAEDTQTVETEN